MKKILFLIPLFALLMGVYSCGDNEDFSNPHILTDDEMVLLHQKDSIDSINRAQFADLIIDLSTTLTVGESYEGKELEFDFSQITDLFGITLDELIEGLEDGSVASCIYVYDGTTYTLNSASPTAGSSWSYWVDSKGNPASWNNGSVVYAEWYGMYYSEDESASPNIMNVGQFPDALSEGDEVTFIPTLKYQGKTAAVRIKITIVAEEPFVDPESKPGTTPADMTKDITLTKDWDSEWGAAEYDAHDDLCNAFNMTTYELSTALDAGDLRVYLNEVSDSAPSYTAEPGGYWINSEGQATSYSNDSYIYTGVYFDYTASSIVIDMGNYPDETMCPKGITLTYKFIITDGTTTVTYNVTSNVN